MARCVRALHHETSQVELGAPPSRSSLAKTVEMLPLTSNQAAHWEHPVWEAHKHVGLLWVQSSFSEVAEVEVLPPGAKHPGPGQQGIVAMVTHHKMVMVLVRCGWDGCMVSRAVL